MGRMKRSWYYARQAAQAEARETYYRNRRPPVNTTVPRVAQPQPCITEASRSGMAPIR
jgi:hypothetical protein